VLHGYYVLFISDVWPNAARLIAKKSVISTSSERTRNGLHFSNLCSALISWQFRSDEHRYPCTKVTGVIIPGTYLAPPIPRWSPQINLNILNHNASENSACLGLEPQLLSGSAERDGNRPLIPFLFYPTSHIPATAKPARGKGVRDFGAWIPVFV